ncbi:hypothetical protein BC939DRAFT_452015 [Gamsiella multidivaricata]|uniref:uncharacterized protein n=1 Tax=Gamsiella multidivaricata TaxID=101098 RepID=UPI00221E5C38|nr:uncharacterized protein BC939DRAFT_452015 [Gamsiella multidivaricata]KAI7823167.1 hypothetical protein BC939DRAFT_452015 [Gamsiella multidivaricata]
MLLVHSLKKTLSPPDTILEDIMGLVVYHPAPLRCIVVCVLSLKLRMRFCILLVLV